LESLHLRLFFMRIENGVDRLFELVTSLVVGLAHDLLLSSVALTLLYIVSAQSQRSGYGEPV
jgi:hypothetical protein